MENASSLGQSLQARCSSTDMRSNRKQKGMTFHSFIQIFGGYDLYPTRVHSGLKAVQTARQKPRMTRQRRIIRASELA